MSMAVVRVTRPWGERGSIHVLMAAFGLSAAFAGAQTTRHVWTNGLHAAGFTTWANAATNIQAAIDASTAGDTVVVRAGVYDSGFVTDVYQPRPAGAVGLLPTRVNVNKAITLRSETGDPATTIIKGAWDPVTTNGLGAVRGVHLNTSARLIGFTVTGGATYTNGNGSSYQDHSGGGVSERANAGASVSNCVIVGNTAATSGGGVIGATIYDSVITNNAVFPAATGGGGMSGGTSHRCLFINNRSTHIGGGVQGGSHYSSLIIGNYAKTRGGGADFAVGLHNCTVTRNYAGRGGGVTYCKLNNSIVHGNHADLGASYVNWDYMAAAYTVSNSCISPTAGLTGSGIYADDPQFVATGSGYGLALAPGDYRLKKGSPCIDRGAYAAWMNGALDMDRRRRVFGDDVDTGAYEYWVPIGTSVLVR